MEIKRVHLVIFVLATLANNVSLLNAQLFFAPPPPPPQPSSSSSSASSCVNRLYPCLRYLNSTRDPPDSCCNPLKSVIKSDPQCICRMISTQGAFQAQLLGINISQVEMLPGRCGEHVNPLGCLTGVGGSRSSLQNSASIRSLPSLLLLACAALLMLL
uniref:Bifunctional inhibitor/plant lipid transfer protein/seed storage helical domain-containing protein n=1 Tax=Opuntia streptacantha TaxID=393608 RepID=A0A7C8ZYB2_OPUST